jgi:hypothetical protein
MSDVTADNPMVYSVSCGTCGSVWDIIVWEQTDSVHRTTNGTGCRCQDIGLRGGRREPLGTDVVLMDEVPA